MPRTASWLALAAIVLLIAVFFGSRVELRENSGSGPARSTDVGGASTATPLADPLAADERAAARAEASDAAMRSDLDLASAIWVAGRVIVPPGTPADEHAEVVAYYEHRSKDESRRFPIAADGSFRIAFPRDSARAWLDLAARYLYFREAIAVVLVPVPGEIVLRPELGGCVRGVCVPEPGALAMRDELVGTKVSAIGKSAAWVELAVARQPSDGTVDADLRFEIGGLAPDVWYILGGRPRAFAPFRLEGLHARPGETKSVEIPVRLGVELRGRVVDESSSPIASTEVRVQMFQDDAPPETFSTKTAEDGGFALTGVTPGHVVIEALPVRQLFARATLGKLAAGTRRDDVVIVVKDGASLRARVQWSDGTPADGANVSIELVPSKQDQQSDMGPWHSRASTADHDGLVEFTRLTEGPFVLEARATRDDSSRDDATATPHSGPDGVASARRSGRAISSPVLAGGESVLLTLDPSIDVAGRVVDDTGAPVETFEVRALPTDLDEEYHAHKLMRSDEAPHRDGRFVLAGLYDASWKLDVEGGGTRVSRTIDLPRDAEVTLEITLPRPATVTGTVVDAQGDPVEGADVQIASSAFRGYRWWKNARSTTTEADGRFEFARLSPEPSTLRAARHDFAPAEPVLVDLAPGERRDAVLALQRGGRIECEVIEDGRPSTECEVLIQRTELLEGRSIVVWTDATGRCTSDVLPAGTYRVISYHARPNDLGPVLATVVDGETTHVVLADPSSSESSVRVHGTITANGKPEPGAEVEAVCMQGEWQMFSMPSTTVGEGRYEVVLSHPGRWTFHAWSTGQSRIADITVDIPRVDEYTLDIAVPTGAIRGRVVDPRGDPIAHVDVQLRLHPAEQRSPEGNSIDHTSTDSDARGAFEFTRVGPGTYALSANENVKWWPWNPSLRGQTSVSGVRVRDGEAVEDVVLTIDRSTWIDVRAIDARGQPVAGADVFAFDERGVPFSEIALITTDAAGHARIAGMAPPTARVFVRKGPRASEVGPPLALRSGEGVEAVLVVNDAAVLDVIAVDSDGRAVDADVYARDERGLDLAHLYSLSAASLRDAPAETRRKIVGPLPPGRYTLTVIGDAARVVVPDVVVSGAEQREVRVPLGK